MVIATVTTGKASRIPKTAISTPTARKIFRQKTFIFFRIPASTTALPNDGDTSRTARIATTPSAAHPSYSTPATSPSTVQANAHRKVLSATATHSCRQRLLSVRPLSITITADASGQEQRPVP